VERSAHARKSEVFPLPGGAEITVTRLLTARSSICSRPCRWSRPRGIEVSLENCPGGSLCCVVTGLSPAFILGPYVSTAVNPDALATRSNPWIRSHSRALHGASRFVTAACR
jgi:hypothetical protein